MSDTVFPDIPDWVCPNGLLPETPHERLMSVSLDADPGFRRIPIDQWEEKIQQKYNTSYWVWSVFNQGQVGSCASESADGGVKLIRRKHGLPDIEFNPYGTYGRVNGGSDRGSTLSANLAFKRNRGAFDEKVWPRSNGWQREPSSAAYEDAKKYRLIEYFRIPDNDWEAFGSALLLGYVVYWGYTGHAILGVDLLSPTSFRYLNSWGQWGQGSPYNQIGYGFGTARNSSIQWAYGAYAFQTVMHEVGI